MLAAVPAARKHDDSKALPARQAGRQAGRQQARPASQTGTDCLCHVNVVCRSKTTVASIYGAILRDLGLLSKGDVLVKVPADFLGSVLGESEKKTLAILEEARGRVLVIDEAYGLHAGKKSVDPYKVRVPTQALLRLCSSEQLWNRCPALQSA